MVRFDATSPVLVAGGKFPRTRYLGSKRKLAGLILDQLQRQGLEFNTVLDAFGGTGSLAHALKGAGKRVTYNDVLAFNHQIGLALIENDDRRLDEPAVDSIVGARPGVVYDDFIERTFEGIYFTPEENRWLDMAVQNIGRLANPYDRAVASFALFQSALAKRPYNLFHRRNLYMRMASVRRGFGNKATWDRPFEMHFRTYVAEAAAALIDSRGRCRATCADVMSLEPGYDLVYIDPPYVARTGVGVDYRDFYHFLEGLAGYERWPRIIDGRSRHRRLIRTKDAWSDATGWHERFGDLFDHFRKSVLVVSYRSDGIPSIGALADLLAQAKRRVEIIALDRYQYALSTRRDSREILLIGT